MTPASRTVGHATPFALAFARRWLLPAVRLAHRATLEGTSNLPKDGPYLLVANHSGALGIAELVAFAALWADTFGASRPLAGFAHPLGFRVFPLSRVLAEVGAIPSTYEAAHAALSAGVPLLVFPGGDHDALRPIWRWRRVDFGGRRGFLRIARRAGVPIVPMGISGSHFTAPILWQSRLLAYVAAWPRLCGVKRWSLSALAVLTTLLVWTSAPLSWPWRVAIAWLALASPTSMIPWVPWKIRIRIGAPIAAETLFAGDATRDEERALGDALATVEGAVRRLTETGSGLP
ncbi:MAG: 1-acyl-sn-glycerol-3-phosphate acyltransferase [Labilithrix sp.]|nr:1-acyl-sn-glycerol-3-phosphate acyltransferase [Labilithrix sp.]MCW5835613.1 1-acyl-sn-glycerol-3-phosphate acyltransferase [Labilithrix sp.]